MQRIHYPAHQRHIAMHGFVVDFFAQRRLMRYPATHILIAQPADMVREASGRPCPLLQLGRCMAHDWVFDVANDLFPGCHFRMVGIHVDN